MSIYTNGAATWTTTTKYMVARTSKVKATDVGHIYNLIDSANAVEQGSNRKLGTKVTGDWDVYNALVPAIGDKIVFVCDVPLIYSSYTSEDQYEYKFINRAKKEFRAYEIVADDIIGVSDYGITPLNGTTGVVVGNLVVVNGAGKWAELAANAVTTTYGFVATIVGFESYEYDRVVLFKVVKNATV